MCAVSGARSRPMRKSIHSFPRMTRRERLLLCAWEAYALVVVLVVAYLAVQAAT